MVRPPAAAGVPLARVGRFGGDAVALRPAEAAPLADARARSTAAPSPARASAERLRLKVAARRPPYA